MTFVAKMIQIAKIGDIGIGDIVSLKPRKRLTTIHNYIVKVVVIMI